MRSLVRNCLVLWLAGCEQTSDRLDAGPGSDAPSSGSDAPAGDAPADTPGDAPAQPTLNGCTDADFAAGTVIEFGGRLGASYEPPCLRIAPGTAVTFAGDFTTHPLSRGTPDNPSAGSPDSPIPRVAAGTSKTIAFPIAGTYPFICTVHGGVGMVGAVRVQ